MKKKKAEIEYVNEESDNFEQKVKKQRALLKTCKEERAAHLVGWQRAQADLQNYRKQKDEEMVQFRKFVAEDTIQRILPVLDNLTLACGSISQEDADNTWTKGIMHIKKQFEGVLREQGVEEIAVADKTKFDLSLHEAVEEVKSKQKSGTIVGVVQKGYMLNGKVIRAVRVRLAK